VLSGLKKILAKNKIFKTEDDVPVGKLYEKNVKIFFTLKSLKKGVRFGVGFGSGSISQRYGSGHPDPHQNVKDPPTLEQGAKK
jgi:hypothetical protein